MLFAFYYGRNGRGHDLICKALGTVDDYRAGTGASLQLNAERTFAIAGDKIQITHHGDVTRTHKIKRELLAELIQSANPVAVRELGEAFSEDSWPILLGDTGAPATFIDRLYLYSSCIQAAKDAFDSLKRGEPEDIPTGTGQGHTADPELRSAVENHAMRLVEAHYTRQDYAVKDVHRTPGNLDFSFTRGGAEVSVEVKGTMSSGDNVELTAGELAFVLQGTVRVDLAVVANIRLDRTVSPPRASGGDLVIYGDFDPDDHTLTATRYRCKLERPRGDSQ